MKDIFPHFYSSEEHPDLELFWQDATISFDANILLELGAYDAVARQQWFDKLKALKKENRLFLPYQVAYEYLLGLPGKLDNARKTEFSANKLKIELKGATELVQNDSLLVLRKDVIQQMKEARKSAQEKVDTASRECAEQLLKLVETWKVDFENEWAETKNTLGDIFSGVTAKCPPVEDIRTRCQEAELRYVQNIPPGYLDKGKTPFGNQYGDALIWFELKEHAKKTGKPIVFVSLETKPDWWLHFDKSEPRPELALEFIRDTGCRFQLAKVDSFVNWMNKAGTAPESVSEVKRVEDARLELFTLLDWAKYGGRPQHHFTRFNDQEIEYKWRQLPDSEKREVLFEIDHLAWLGKQSELGYMYRVTLDDIEIVYKLESDDAIRIYSIRADDEIWSKISGIK